MAYSAADRGNNRMQCYGPLDVTVSRVTVSRMLQGYHHRAEAFVQIRSRHHPEMSTFFAERLFPALLHGE
jgi:hypothetical protein